MLNQYEIHVGLQDKDLSDFEHECNAAAKEFLKNFSEYKIDFSLSFQKGGYVSNSEEYVLENSIKLDVIGDYSEEQINNVVTIVKEYFNQETVLLVRKPINAEFRS